MASPNNEKQINIAMHPYLIQGNPGGEILGLGSFHILKSFSHSKERTKRNDAIYFDDSEKLKFTPLIPGANSWQTADNIDISQLPRSTQYNTVNIGNNDMTWQDASLIGCVKKNNKKQPCTKVYWKGSKKSSFFFLPLLLFYLRNMVGYLWFFFSINYGFYLKHFSLISIFPKSHFTIYVVKSLLMWFDGT